MVGRADSDVSKDCGAFIFVVRHSKKNVFFAQTSTVLTSMVRWAGHADRVFKKKRKRKKYIYTD